MHSGETIISIFIKFIFWESYLRLFEVQSFFVYELKFHGGTIERKKRFALSTHGC